MPLMVIKVGSSILADQDAYAEIARRIVRQAKLGPTWVVLSAARGATDDLLALATNRSPAALASILARHTALAPEPLPLWLGRELRRATRTPGKTANDSVVAWGERASNEILRQHLRALDAEPALLELKPRWPSTIAPLVLLPGFYFRDARRKIHILPRGACDAAAVYVAYRLGVDAVTFWQEHACTTADGKPQPTILPEELLRRIGATTDPVHPAAVTLAVRHGIELVLENPFSKGVATRVLAKPAIPVAPRIAFDPDSEQLRSALA